MCSLTQKLNNQLFHFSCWVPAGGSRYAAKYTIKTTQKPEGLMVWAAMKSNGRIKLLRCPPNVNSEGYCNILSKALKFISPRCS